MLRCSARGGMICLKFYVSPAAMGGVYSPKRSVFRTPRGGRAAFCPCPTAVYKDIIPYSSEKLKCLGEEIFLPFSCGICAVFTAISARPRHCSGGEERVKKPTRRFVKRRVGTFCFFIYCDQCVPPVQPRLMSRAPSTFCMVERGREPMRSFSRRLSSVRICSSRMTESFCSP